MHTLLLLLSLNYLLVLTRCTRGWFVSRLACKPIALILVISRVLKMRGCAIMKFLIGGFWAGEEWRDQVHYRASHSIPRYDYNSWLSWISSENQATPNSARWRSLLIENRIQGGDNIAGKPGEQWTMFFKDPSGNSLEFKAMTNPANLFAKYYVEDWLACMQPTLACKWLRWIVTMATIVRKLCTY